MIVRCELRAASWEVVVESVIAGRAGTPIGTLLGGAVPLCGGRGQDDALIIIVPPDGN
jgi:hypothetical protein